MNARIQSWFPFYVQLCLNGREWLGRQMDRAHLRYARLDNCFAWIEDFDKAQKLMDRQPKTHWPKVLDGISRMLNPAHGKIFNGFSTRYYWSAYQSEWASDIAFLTASRSSVPRRAIPAAYANGALYAVALRICGGEPRYVNRPTNAISTLKPPPTPQFRLGILWLASASQQHGRNSLPACRAADHPSQPLRSSWVNISHRPSRERQRPGSVATAACGAWLLAPPSSCGVLERQGLCSCGSGSGRLAAD